MITHLGSVRWIRAELPQACLRLYSFFTQLCPSPDHLLQIKPAYSKMSLNEFISSDGSTHWLVRNGIDPSTASTSVDVIRQTTDLIARGQSPASIRQHFNQQMNAHQIVLAFTGGTGLTIDLTLEQSRTKMSSSLDHNDGTYDTRTKEGSYGKSDRQPLAIF